MLDTITANLHLPIPSLWISKRKPSFRSGSQAQGTGLERNLWLRKCRKSVNVEHTWPGKGSGSWRCSRNALPPSTWTYRYRLDGSIFAKMMKTISWVKTQTVVTSVRQILVYDYVKKFLTFFQMSNVLVHKVSCWFWRRSCFCLCGDILKVDQPGGDWSHTVHTRELLCASGSKLGFRHWKLYIQLSTVQLGRAHVPVLI